MPKYEGASKYQATPFALVAARWRGLEFNLVGTELKVDLGGGGRFLFGPVIGISNSRSISDAEGPVKLLDRIKSSASYGGFAGVRFGGNENGQGRIVASVQATKDTKSEKGMTFDVGLSYAAIRQEKIFATFDLGAKLNDKVHADVLRRDGHGSASWLGYCGIATGARVPSARLRPPRLRNFSRSLRYSRYTLLRFMPLPSRCSRIAIRR